MDFVTFHCRIIIGEDEDVSVFVLFPMQDSCNIMVLHSVLWLPMAFTSWGFPTHLLASAFPYLMAGISIHHIFVLEHCFCQKNSFYPKLGQKHILLSFLWASIEFSGPTFPFQVPTFLGPKVTSPVPDWTL